MNDKQFDIENFDMAWGSCQYDRAAQYYAMLCQLEKEFGRDNVLQTQGITLNDPLPNEQIWSAFHAAMLETINDYDDDEFQAEMREELGPIDTTKDIDDMFDMLRNMAWDLWAAAPFMFDVVFPNAVIDKKLKTPDKYCFGPVLNKAVQSCNDETGLYCWVLHSFADVHESNFVDFDT